jgi:hypothetical protein
MSSGGSRNRSGPAADPNSERSQQRGITYKLLPREGFKRRAPAFPLPDQTEREKVVWRELWKTPQAAMWWAERHFRLRSVANYTRLSVRCEDAAAPAALFNQLHRYGDQLGLTPAGLKENGWRLASDELAEKRTTTTVDEEPSRSEAKPAKTEPTRRLRAVSV